MSTLPCRVDPGAVAGDVGVVLGQGAAGTNALEVAVLCVGLESTPRRRIWGGGGRKSRERATVGAEKKKR